MATSSADALATYDIELYTNDSLFEEFEYKINKVGVDLTGASMLMHVRTGGPGSTLDLELSTGNGGIVIDADQVTNPGKFHVTATIAAVHAASGGALSPDSGHPYDIVLIQPAQTKRLFEGKIKIKQGITEVP